MNSLQIELNTINEKLELLTYRKTQLEAVINEYSDVVNRVKSLIETMQDANVEPSNLLMEIESLIYCHEAEAEEAEVTPKPELTPIESYLNELPSETPEPTPEPTSKPFSFDLRLFPKPSPELTPEEPETGATEPTPEEPVTDDDNDCDTDGLEDVDYGFDDDSDDNEEPIPTTHRTPPGSKYFLPMTYWDHEKSVRMFIGKKSHSKGELEAIISDCLCQELAEKYEINECGKDWIVTLSPVTNEANVHSIIANFYPAMATSEPVRLMVAVPAVVTPTLTPTPEPTPKTQLNERAWRRGDTLLIGFSNKRLLNTWAKWFKDSWSDRVKIDSLDKVEGFDHCLSILWFGQADWERLSKLDYSLKPTVQNKQEQQPETPPKVTSFRVQQRP